MNSLCVRRANVRLGAAVLLTTIVLVLLAARPAAAAGQLTWVADTPPTSATVGTPYSYHYVAQGPPGDPPPVYAVVGSLPPGLALDRSTGVLSGTPAAAGDFHFQIEAISLPSVIVIFSPWTTISVAGQPTWVANSPPTSATVGTPYSYQYVAQSPPGDPPPVYTRAGGSLPSGLALDTSTGVLSGTPAAAGDFTFRIEAISRRGVIFSPWTTISVARGSQQVVITSSAPAPAVVGTTYQVTATGGASGNPVVFSRNANSTEGACDISASGLVTFTGVGTCIVNAFQAGDANYAPARASQTITVSSVPSPSPSTSPPAPSSRPHAPARSAPEPAHPAARAELAVTGTNTIRSVALAIVLVVVGVALVMVAGRRQGIH